MNNNEDKPKKKNSEDNIESDSKLVSKTSWNIPGARKAVKDKDLNKFSLPVKKPEKEKPNSKDDA